MKHPIYRAFAWIAILVIIVSTACSLSGGSQASTSLPPGPAAQTMTDTPQVASGANQNSVPTPTAMTPGSGGCANAYYPVSSGSTWSYSSSGGNKGDYTYTRTISTLSDTGFSTSDQYSTGVNWIAKWTCQDGNLAALDAGADSASMTTSKYTLTSDSVKVNGYNIPATFDQGRTWSEDIKINGTIESNAGKTVNSQITATLDCSASGADEITVPAGKFDAVMATCTRKVVVSAMIQAKETQLGANQETITFWYSKGVGLVKSVATGGSNNETIQLTQYQIQ